MKLPNPSTSPPLRACRCSLLSTPSTRTAWQVSKYTRAPSFDPEEVGNVSQAAKSLCMWVRAMEVYGRIAKEVSPNRRYMESRHM